MGLRSGCGGAMPCLQEEEEFDDIDISRPDPKDFKHVAHIGLDVRWMRLPLQPCAVDLGVALLSGPEVLTDAMVELGGCLADANGYW